MQLEQEQIEKVLKNLNVGDAFIALQLIERLTQTNGLRSNELATVGIFRNRLVQGVQEVTGINYDEVVAAQAAAQQRAALMQQDNAEPAPAANPAPKKSKPTRR